MDRLSFWLGRLSPGYARVSEGTFNRWGEWLVGCDSPMSHMTPDELVDFQRNAVGEDRYLILNWLQDWISSRSDWSVRYKRHNYAVIRSFFMHNRAELPKDRSFIIRSDKSPAIGRVSLEEFKLILASCNPMYRAIYLCMFQGALGINEFLYWNSYGLKHLENQLGRTNPIKIYLPGRKKNKNELPYYTFIGLDAIDALNKWWVKRPQDAETIFVSQTGSSLSEWAIRMYWLRHLERLGLIIKVDTRGMDTEKYGIRYEKNPHTLRKLFRTRWQKSGGPSEVSEFLMGHEVDRLDYNRFMEDERYVRREYRKAETWLNILSKDPEHVHIDDMTEMQSNFEKRMEDMERQIKLMSEYLRNKH